MKFCLELKNRFKVLEDLDQTVETLMEQRWENIKEVYQQIAEKTIGFHRKNDK
jgi:hypothetical protein